MKSCRVFFRDRGGVEHAVYVEAVHRYHAFGLAMYGLRHCSWSNPDYSEVQRLSIELLDSRKSERIVITRDEFETWLNTKVPMSKADKARDYLLMLLGRVPPDRDFKRMRGMR